MGMATAHAQASGMGGMRAGGDLVARLQLSKGMRINEAKKYVADKLKVSTLELSDPVVMQELRAEKGLGVLMPFGGNAKGIQCKFNIASVLDIKVNCVDRFRKFVGLL
jgi:Dimethylamine methyltransferase (Dimeth_PyL).